MKFSITVKESIYIPLSQEKVWDFTQDYSQRPLWDHAIIEAEEIPSQYRRLVRVQMKGNFKTTFKYKANDRPNKTSLSMVDTKSNFFKGGGGSWKYEANGDGTLWTQTNTLRLKLHPINFILFPFFHYFLKKNTREAMNRAKVLMSS